MAAIGIHKTVKKVEYKVPSLAKAERAYTRKRNADEAACKALAHAGKSLRGFFEGCDFNGYSIPWLIVCSAAKPADVLAVLADWVRKGYVKYSSDHGQCHFTPVKKYFKL